MNDKKKVDISSTAIEKGIDIAKGFADKLVLPPIEELGLLIKDQMSYWRFSNKVRILNKAKDICEKNNISVKAIPPKLLCPYLDNASLEDDNELQDKWAALLVNMVDSQQNIQNHVFPYILSQLSKEEFNLLESALIEKNRRVEELQKELNDFLADRPDVELSLNKNLNELKQELENIEESDKRKFASPWWKLRSKIRKVENELRSLDFKETAFNRKINAPQQIPEQIIEEFEIANIIRLGLAKVVYEAMADTHSIEVPGGEPDDYTTVDFDIDIETETSTILTQLGELFIDACREKDA